MPASTKHILMNVERMTGDEVLLKLWRGQAQTMGADGVERSIGQAWLSFIDEADQLHIADRIPGAVGKKFQMRYADEPANARAKGAVNREVFVEGIAK